MAFVCVCVCVDVCMHICVLHKASCEHAESVSRWLDNFVMVLLSYQASR